MLPEARESGGGKEGFEKQMGGTGFEQPMANAQVRRAGRTSGEA